MLAPSLVCPVLGGEAERLLEQRAAAIGVVGVGADRLEALERQLRGDLRVVGDQRLVGHGHHQQLMYEPFEVREPQALAVPL